MSKMNTDQQEASLTKELHDLNNSVSEFHQFFANYQKQIKDQFNPLYNEQTFNDWQQYCSHFSDAISLIVFLSYLISESDPTQFLTVLQLLQEMVDHTFSIISPYLCALRFRGNFKECQLKSKDSHEKIAILFNKVFDIISGIIDKCPVQLVEYYKEKISTLCSYIRSIHSEYNQNVENLINAMKSDPRFSTFNDSEHAEKTAKKDETTEKVAPIKKVSKFNVPEKFVDVLFQLTSLLLSENQISDKDIRETYNSLTDEFNKFGSSLMSFINELSDINEKTIFLQHYNFTLSTMTNFISEFHVYFERKSHLLRKKTGTSCSLVLLSLFSINSNFDKNTNNDFRRILSETFVSLVNNLDELKQSLETISNSATELHQSDNDVIIYLSDNINQLLAETQKLVQSNTNLKDPNVIGDCLHLFDNLQYLLFSLSSLKDDENKSVSLNAYVFKGLSDSYRLSVQILIINQLNDYCSTMNLFNENVSNQISSAETLQLKDTIFNLINQIEIELAIKPPYSIFNYEFLIKLENLFKNIKDTSLSFLKSFPVFSKIYENIGTITNSLNSLFELVNRIDYSKSIVVPSILGPLFLMFKNDATQNTVKMVNALVSEHSQASLCTFNFINTINNVILLFDKVDDLKQMAIQIKACYSKMIEDSSYVSFGQSSYVESITATIKDLTGIIDGLVSFFQKYTDELKLQSNSYCEKKSQNDANKPTIQNILADILNKVSVVQNSLNGNIENEPVIQNNLNENKEKDSSTTLTTESSETIETKKDLSSEILCQAFQENTKSFQENLRSFVEILLAENNQPNQITNSLQVFHDSIFTFVKVVDQLIDFSWSPTGQKNLSLTRENLINLVYKAIIVSKNAIIKSDEYKTLVSSFNKESTDTINNVICWAEKIFNEEKMNLLVENETERELINAAQFISQTLKQLRSLSNDHENIISSSDDPFCLNAIDIAQPIFMNAAKIIEASRSKVKLILNSGNTLPSQNAFLENTKNLIDSLSLIINVIKSKSCSDLDSISEILEYTKKANISIALFLDEMKKSTNSIQ